MSRETRGKGKGDTCMHGLVLTGRDVRLVLLDVGARTAACCMDGNLQECETVKTDRPTSRSGGLSSPVCPYISSVCLCVCVRAGVTRQIL